MYCLIDLESAVVQLSLRSGTEPSLDEGILEFAHPRDGSRRLLLLQCPGGVSHTVLRWRLPPAMAVTLLQFSLLAGKSRAKILELDVRRGFPVLMISCRWVGLHILFALSFLNATCAVGRTAHHPLWSSGDSKGIELMFDDQISLATLNWRILHNSRRPRSFPKELGVWSGVDAFPFFGSSTFLIVPHLPHGNPPRVLDVCLPVHQAAVLTQFRVWQPSRACQPCEHGGWSHEIRNGRYLLFKVTNAETRRFQILARRKVEASLQRPLERDMGKCE